MTREEHIEEIEKIIKDNKRMRTLIGEQNSLLCAMRDYTSADVEEAYQDGYKLGYEDGVKSVQSWDEVLKAEGYESGLNIAWGLAKKIVVDMDVHERAKIFFDNAEAATHEEPFKSYSFEEAFRKMAEYEKQKYEKQKKEIKVGDEIIFSDDTTGYVIMPDYNEEDMLVSTSDCACLQLIRKSNKNPFFKWEKTGMRNGEIVKMVKAIKEES